MDRFLLLRQFFQVMKSGFRAANNVQPDPEPIRLPGFANVRKNSLFPVKHTEERRNDKSVGFSKPPQQTRQIFLGLIHQMPKLIRENLFREDLFYRIKEVEIRLPALRERNEDIPLLVHHFIGLSAKFPERWAKRLILIIPFLITCCYMNGREISGS
jgi:hypothetical protein